MRPGEAWGASIRGLGSWPGRTLRACLAATVLLVGWRILVTRSVRRDTGSLRRAVVEYCRHGLGLPSDWRGPPDFETAFAGCEDVEILSAQVAGGMLDPVMVRIALRRGPAFPAEYDSVALRNALVSMPVVASLGGLATGRWDWNPAVGYSDFRFWTSF
ncbi:MAG: hypothetical protein ACKO2K_19685 [Alphaproteobacteria bacterium]